MVEKTLKKADVKKADVINGSICDVVLVTKYSTCTSSKSLTAMIKADWFPTISKR